MLSALWLLKALSTVLMIRRLLFSWPLLCAVTLSTATAYAAPSASQLAEAKRLFAQAVRFEKLGNWKQALKRLRRVVKIKETAGVRYHIAVCLEHQKLFAQAMNGYEQAKRLAADGSAPDVAKMVSQKIDSLRSRVVMITVNGTLQGEHEIVLRVDESPALVHIELGEPFAVTPKLHRLVLQVDGRVRLDRFVDQKAGSQVTLVLRALNKPQKPAVATKPKPHVQARRGDTNEAGAAAASPPDRDENGGVEHSTMGWILTGTGGAIAVGGVLAYLKAGQVSDDSAKACLISVACDERRAQVVRQWDSAALGLWIGAAVTAGVGLTLVLTTSGENHRPPRPVTALVMQPTSFGVRTTF